MILPLLLILLLQSSTTSSLKDEIIKSAVGRQIMRKWASVKDGMALK